MVLCFSKKLNQPIKGKKMKKVKLTTHFAFISAIFMCIAMFSDISFATVDPCAKNTTQDACINTKLLPQQLPTECSTAPLKTCAWDATAKQCSSACVTDSNDDCNKAKAQSTCEKRKPGKKAQKLCGGKAQTVGCHWLITTETPAGYCSVDCK
jgi:hypothetical protein